MLRMSSLKKFKWNVTVTVNAADTDAVNADAAIIIIVFKVTAKVFT